MQDLESENAKLSTNLESTLATKTDLEVKVNEMSKTVDCLKSDLSSERLESNEYKMKAKKVLWEKDRIIDSLRRTRKPDQSGSEASQHKNYYTEQADFQQTM